MAEARVKVAGEVVGEIGAGLLIYLGVGPDDTEALARHFAQRLVEMRIFPDANGRMNRSLLQASGSALVVSQFTLFADNRRGHRPSFKGAGLPELGSHLCSSFQRALVDLGVVPVAGGRFGAHMEVESRNDGPVTIVATCGEGPWEAKCG